MRLPKTRENWVNLIVVVILVSMVGSCVHKTHVEAMRDWEEKQNKAAAAREACQCNPTGGSDDDDEENYE